MVHYVCCAQPDFAIALDVDGTPYIKNGHNYRREFTKFNTYTTFDGMRQVGYKSVIIIGDGNAWEINIPGWKLILTGNLTFNKLTCAALEYGLKGTLES